jgi:hypothetical protein
MLLRSTLRRGAVALLRLYGGLNTQARHELNRHRLLQIQCNTHSPCTPSAIPCLQVMYAYYACSCVGIRWPKPLARNITTLQLAQMFVNVAILVTTCFTCGPNQHASFWLAADMHACFACLFMGLNRQRYSNNQKKQSREHEFVGCQYAKGLLRGAAVCCPCTCFCGLVAWPWFACDGPSAQHALSSKQPVLAPLVSGRHLLMVISKIQDFAFDSGSLSALTVILHRF